MSHSKNKIRTKTEAKTKLPNKYQLFGMYLLFILVIIFIWGKTTSFDFAIDDKIVIVDNVYVNTGLPGFVELFKVPVNNNQVAPGVTKVLANQRPVTMFSHALDVSLFGMNPGLHHLTNVLLYIILAFLLFHLLRKYLIPKFPVFISFSIVLLFIVHPVHVEAVANIKGRDDILCFIFGTLSLIFFFRHLKEKTILNRMLGLAFLILAILSKETGVVFAVLIPLSYYYFSDSDLKKAFISTWLYMAVGVFLIFVRLAFFKEPREFITLYNNSLLAIVDPLQRLAMTFRILLHYIQLSFWPHPLCWDYSFGHFEFNKFTYLRAITSFAVYGGLLTWVITKLKSKNFIGYGIIFFMVALFPVSNLIIKIASTFGERLLFIPSFGFAFALIFLIRGINKKLSAKFKYNKVYPMYLFIFFITTTFLFQSSARTNVWKNDALLVNTDYTYSRSLRNTRAYIQNLTSLTDNKISNNQKALEVCKDALNRFSDDWQLWYFKGIIQTTLNNPGDAKHAFQKSVEYNGTNFFSLVSYGDLIANEEPDKAIELYRRAILIKSDNAVVFGNLGILLHKKGKLQEANEMYERSLKLDSNNKNVSYAYKILKKSLVVKK